MFQTPIPDSPGTTGRLAGGLGGASRLLPAVCRSFVFDSSRAQMGGSRGTNPSQEYRSGRGWAGVGLQ